MVQGKDEHMWFVHFGRTACMEGKDQNGIGVSLYSDDDMWMASCIALYTLEAW